MTNKDTTRFVQKLRLSLLVAKLYGAFLLKNWRMGKGCKTDTLYRIGLKSRWFLLVMLPPTFTSTKKRETNTLCSFQVLHG